MANATKTTDVITWQTPRGRKMRITPEAEKILRDAGVWPRDRDGSEYCQVSHGLHRDFADLDGQDARRILSDQ